MTTREIAISALLTSFLIVAKYVLGFIPGVEIITMTIALIAITFRLRVSLMTVAAFIGAVGIIYGFGSWWLVYWFVYPSLTIASWSLRGILKSNNIVFAIWAFIWSFTLFIWYIPHDIIIFDISYAMGQVAGSIMVNLIGGVSNFALALLLFYPYRKIAKNFVEFNVAW